MRLIDNLPTVALVDKARTFMACRGGGCQGIWA